VVVPPPDALGITLPAEPQPVVVVPPPDDLGITVK
jgi:hypothetical protein